MCIISKYSSWIIFGILAFWIVTFAIWKGYSLLSLRKSLCQIQWSKLGHEKADARRKESVSNSVQTFHPHEESVQLQWSRGWHSHAVRKSCLTRFSGYPNLKVWGWIVKARTWGCQYLVVNYSLLRHDCVDNSSDLGVWATRTHGWKRDPFSPYVEAPWSAGARGVKDLPHARPSVDLTRRDALRRPVKQQQCYFLPAGNVYTTVWHKTMTEEQ